jgi:flagellar motor switch protein FliG
MISLVDDRAAKPVDSLNGVQKAAAIMLTLSEEEGGKVLEHLDDDEIRMLSAAMADMGSVSAAAMGSVVADFDQAVSLYSSVSGSLEKTEAILGKALPADQVKAIMDEIRQPSRGVWKKLSSVDRGLLSAYLKGEHPQPLAINVINRMLRLQPVQKEVLQQLEENLEADLLASFSIKKKMDTHAAMAEVFNSFDRTTETRLMDALEQVNATSSKRIRELMFTFEDLTKLDAAAMQTVIRAADKTMLAKALQGVSEVIMNVFLGNMSSRAAKTLGDDIASMQDLGRNEVESAQGELIRLAKGLIDRGEISKPKGKSEADGGDYDLS